MDPGLVYVDEVNQPLLGIVRMDLAVDLIKRMPDEDADAARRLVLGVDPQARELAEQSRLTAGLLSRVKGMRTHQSYVDERAVRQVDTKLKERGLSLKRAKWPFRAHNLRVLSAPAPLPASTFCAELQRLRVL